MSGFEHYHFSLWWIFPMVMMLLCILMMRGRKRGIGCCSYPKADRRPRQEDSVSAKDILDMRFASGEIDQAEYEAKKELILGLGMHQEAEEGESNANLP